MGDVWEAEDGELGTLVALKTLRAARDERSIQRFRREILLARKVTHPNVCRIFDLGWHETPSGRVAFLTMELLGGETLEERVRREGPLSPAAALAVLSDVARGLDAAHAAGVVHRDLKSANVMLVPGGDGGERAVVTDFGLATGRDSGSLSRLTGIVEIVGTPDYMAPEQVEGADVGPATDVYALGVVAYEMLTGRLPFEGATPMSRAVRRLSEEPAPLPATGPGEVPAAFRAAISRALSREPEGRFASASDFVRALSPASGADSATRLLERPPAPRRRSALAAVAAVAFVAALGAAFLLLRRPAAPEPEPGRRSVAILGFANLSGLPETAWLGTALTEMLATEIAAAEGLRPLPGETVARARAGLALEPSQALSGETLARLRKGTGAALVVHGTYLDLGARGGGRVRLDVRLVDAARGDLLASFSESGDETALDAVSSRAGARLLEALGAQRKGGARRDWSRDREAARLHAEGLARLRLFDARGAEPFLRQAAERDPSDPVLHAALAEALWKLGRDPEARGAARAAFERLGGLPREERLAVEGKLREIVGDTKEAIEAFQALVRLYPDDLDYGLQLAQMKAEAGDARGSLETVASLRKLPPPAGDDVRLDLAEARALSEAESFEKLVEMASRAATRAASDGLPGVRARALRLLGAGLRALGRAEEASAAFEESRALFAKEGDRAAEARVIRDAAGVAWDRDDLAASRREVERALAIFREIGDERGLAVGLETMAVLEKRQGRPAAARVFLTEARDLYVRQGDEGRRLQATHTLANILVSEGDLEGAARNYREVIDGALARGSEEQAGLAQANLGSVLTWEGRLAEARERTDGAVAAFRNSGNRQNEAYALRNLARIHREGGRFDEAEKALARAEETGEAAGGAGPQALEARVELALAADDSAAAARALARFRVAVGEDAGEDEELTLQHLAARVSLSEGRPAEAEAAIRRAIDAAARAVDLEPETKLRLEVAAARAATARGRGAEALRDLERIGGRARDGLLLLVAFDADLARAEAEIALGRAKEARVRLAALAAAARDRGALRLASQAETLLATAVPR
jgi:tetratricopeptide (TPR) repeat protein